MAWQQLGEQGSTNQIQLVSQFVQLQNNAIRDQLAFCCYVILASALSTILEKMLGFSEYLQNAQQ